MSLVNVFRELELYYTRRSLAHSSKALHNSLSSVCSHAAKISHGFILQNLKSSSLIEEFAILQLGCQKTCSTVLTGALQYTITEPP